MTGQAPDGQDKLTFAPPPRSVGGESSADPFIGIPEDDDELEATATRKYPAVGKGKGGASPSAEPAGAVDLDAKTTEHKVRASANDPVAPIKKTMIQQSVPVVAAEAKDKSTARGKPEKGRGETPGEELDSRDVKFEPATPPSVRTTAVQEQVPGHATSPGRVASPAAVLPQPEPVEPKSRAGLVIGLVVLGAIALGGGAFLWMQRNADSEPRTARSDQREEARDGEDQAGAKPTAAGQPAPPKSEPQAEPAADPEAPEPGAAEPDQPDEPQQPDPEAEPEAEPGTQPEPEAEPEAEPEPEPGPVGDASLTDARSKQDSDPDRAYELAAAVYDRHDSDEVDTEALEVMVYTACLIPDGKLAREAFRKLTGKAGRRRVIDHCADEKIVVWSNEKGYTKGELARMAAKIYEKGDYEKAYDLARDSYKKKANKEAMVVMGKAACKLGNSQKAKLALAGIPQDEKEDVRSVCAESGTSVD